MRSCPSTAAVENHVDTASTIATARRTSSRRGEVAEPMLRETAPATVAFRTDVGGGDDDGPVG